MKKSLFFFLWLCISIISTAQNVGINSDGSSPNASAILDVKSINKGLLLPRMTSAQKNSIAFPATGLLIYQTDSVAGFYYNAGLSIYPLWLNLSTSHQNVWTASGNNIYNNNTGRVGIGTMASPQGQLEISMNSGSEPQLLLTETGNDFSRLTYKNSNGHSFTAAGYTAPGTGTDYYNIYSYKKNDNLLQLSSDPKATVAINGSLQVKKVSVTANIGFGAGTIHNNIDIGDASVIELGWDVLATGIGSGPGEITGIAGGVEGRVLYVFKRDQGYRSTSWDNNFYRFIEEDTRSLPQNRFAFQNIDLDNFDGLTLIYLNGRWRCLGRYD